MKSKQDKPGFRITMGRGFQITFANGHTVSVQFGPGTYCENRDMDFSQSALAGEKGSITAETAHWGPDGNFIPMPEAEDDVNGWQTPEQVLELLIKAAKS